VPQGFADQVAMKVLMLGWEYPPHISGGLGTACEGLTRALAQRGVDIDFVVPALLGQESAPHMNLVSAAEGKIVDGSGRGKITKTAVPAFLQPYWSPGEYTDKRTGQLRKMLAGRGVAHYGSNLLAEVMRYTGDVVTQMQERKFDLIHAHDWMTFPAGTELAAVTGKPFVAHVHSLEFDRSGAGANSAISAIEQTGVEQAKRVVAVSHYTKSVISSNLGIPAEKIAVVHNGIYPRNALARYQHGRAEEKLVLFLGRVTFQKGPEYFVEATRKVAAAVPEAKFVMAGSGDMLPRMQEMVHRYGLDGRFSFPGFLKGAQVEEMYARASIYVMPSVSEPFGIAPLEAINCDTPVIISRQSGVSEVLSHAFKVDFWDTDRLAKYIVSALRYGELRSDMLGMAKEEVKRIRWESAAAKLTQLYQTLH
jgi:glycosyltransferase involved in cell wall biosynthesis